MTDKCQVCDSAGPLPAQLAADFGKGSPHAGERYQLQLCESCFFFTLSTLKRQRMVNMMFDQDPPGDDFGRLA